MGDKLNAALHGLDEDERASLRQRVLLRQGAGVRDVSALTRLTVDEISEVQQIAARLLDVLDREHPYLSLRGLLLALKLHAQSRWPQAGAMVTSHVHALAISIGRRGGENR